MFEQENKKKKKREREREREIEMMRENDEKKGIKAILESRLIANSVNA